MQVRLVARLPGDSVDLSLLSCLVYVSARGMNPRCRVWACIAVSGKVESALGLQYETHLSMFTWLQAALERMREQAPPSAAREADPTARPLRHTVDLSSRMQVRLLPASLLHALTSIRSAWSLSRIESTSPHFTEPALQSTADEFAMLRSTCSPGAAS